MIAALLAAASLGAAACAGLPPDKVGLQLFSVRTELTGPQPPFTPGQPRPPNLADEGKLNSLFGRLHGIGYRNLENFGGAWGHSPQAYRAILDRSQLRSVASHDNLDAATWPETLARAKALGQTFVGSGGYGQPGLKTLDDVLQTAANLERLGAEARAQGLRLYVHNHEEEFRNRFPYDLDGDGRPETVSAWEIVAARTTPQNVNFEIDVHWARRAFGLEKTEDLLAFLRKHRSRIVLLHVKDTDPAGEYTDLGRGTTDWQAVFDAAGPQVAYYLWELDRTPDPMGSAAIAYRFMTCGR